MERMPALFIGHGSPMNAISKNSYTEALAALSSRIPRPKGILVVSAHWMGPWLKVTGSESPAQIYDFFGFPDELYSLRYQAPGDPDLASRVADTLSSAGFPCHVDPSRGIDHAAWAVLLHMYPKADIPVLEMSLDYRLPFRKWFEVGMALAGLRDSGVLVLGSGNIVHNLYKLSMDPDAAPFEWAVSFDTLVKSAIESRNWDLLASYAEPVSASREAVPTPEHYLPLLAILGAMGEGEDARPFHQSLQNASVSMTGYEISSF